MDYGIGEDKTMPCLKCDAVIPTGTAIRIANGLMCSTCLPSEKIDLMRHLTGSNISNWSYIEDVSTINRSCRYLLTDTIGEEDYSHLRYVYYVYPLDQQEIRAADSMDSCEYLLLNGGCKIYDTHFSNCTVIALGHLEVYNTRIVSCYLARTVQEGFYHHLLMKASHITYIRGMGYLNYPTIDVTLDNCSIPDDCSEIYIRNFTAKHIRGDIAVHNGAASFTARIENSIVDNLHFCQPIEDLALVNSTVRNYDTEDYYTNNLTLEEGTITLFDERLILHKNIISGNIIMQHFTTCSICNRPIRWGETLSVKGTTVHKQCMARNSYSTRDFDTIGSSTILPPFGFELEMRHGCYSEPQEYLDLIYDLMMHGFKRCSDSTVNDEMKSPILRSDKWMLDITPILNTVAESYIDDHCGTHIHVSSSPYTLSFLKKRSGMFMPISEYMHEHEDSTRKIWGRYFNDRYATMEVKGDDRTCWLNISGSNHVTIEYRLPQLQSMEQYQRLVYFCRLLTLRLNKIYEDYNSRRGGVFYTSKMGNEILKFYQKFEKLTLGVK